MLHHTRISIGSDDVTMLRLQLFFLHTLRLRHMHVITGDGKYLVNRNFIIVLENNCHSQLRYNWSHL